VPAIFLIVGMLMGSRPVRTRPELERARALAQ
jgi:hypothetical protein